MSVSKLAAVWLLSVGAGTKAFVPLPPNTRVGPAVRTTANPSLDTAPQTATTLYMGGRGNLFDRAFRILNSNLNKALSGLEDPEKIVVQAVADMQNDLVKIRQAYAEATASQRRMVRQQESSDAQASEWYKRANLALQRDNEMLAKEALSRRQAYVDQSKSLQQQIDIQTAATDKLYSAMMALEGKIQEAAAKKQQLVARAKTAKSTQQVNDMLSGLTGKTSMDAFNRMEEKVEALEASAEASAEMSLLGSSSMTDLEVEFQLLEASSAVEDELDKMKREMRMLGGSTEPVRESGSIPIRAAEKAYSR